MTSKRNDFKEDTQFRIFRLLQDNPEMSQRELANAVGVSVGGMHYVLTALIDKGFVKLGNFTAAKDKRRYAYILTPKGIAEKAIITKRFLARKMEEFEVLKEEIAALENEVNKAPVWGEDFKLKFSETISLDRLLNIILRFSTLGLRFVFILMLAKFLDPEMVGYYGLFTATVGYAIYFVGMEFYIFTTRAILRSPPDQRGRLLKGQATLSGALYLVVLPLALYLISQKVWPAYLLWWFIPLVMLEHLNQELSRLLTAMSQQVTASLVLFLRQGSWAIASLVLFVTVPESHNLHLVFGLWAAGGLAAAGLGIWKIKQLDISGWREPIDWQWMRQGILISLGFLAATLALRTMYTLDRYWIEALGGFDMVAAYVLFFGIASVLLAFLDAGVFAFIYPDLIRLNHEGEHIKARTLIRRSFLQTVAACIAFAVISLALLPYVLDWIDKPIYHSATDFYPWLLSAMILNAIGLIPHYALYARGHDKTNIFSHFAALVVFVIATWIFSRDGSPMAVLIGLNLAFLTVLIIKTVAYFYLIKPSDDPVTDHSSTQMKMDDAKS